MLPDGAIALGISVAMLIQGAVQINANKEKTDVFM
jgi:hypothetical protein